MFNKNKKTILAIVLAGFVTCSTTQVNATTFDSIKNRLGVAVQYIWRSMKNSVQDINLGEIKTDTLNALETNKNVQVGAGIGIATSILNLSSPTIRNLSLNVLKATFHYTKLATMWTFNKMLTNKPLQYFMLGCIATKMASSLYTKYFCKSHTNTNIGECSICLAQILPAQSLTKTTCNHYFHSACLKNWLNQNNNCPICRMTDPTASPST